jgi:hypothetical protein
MRRALPLLLAAACAPADPGAPADTDPAADTETPFDPPDDARRDAVCAAWNASRLDLSEGSWTGDLATCDPGDVPGDARDRAVAVLNAWRFIADLPLVDHDPVLDADAQACALVQHANDRLEHRPTPDAACWSEQAATAAARSNLATSGAVYAVDMYMQDWGNETTMGHRRWLLGEELGPIGVGSTSEFSCMHVTAGRGAQTRDWVAWPPPGPVPIGTLTAGDDRTTDETGWTIQSDVIDLSAAAVTVRSNGVPFPVDVVVLLPEYGSDWAINLLPIGWSSAVGVTYEVQVDNVSAPFSYQFTFVDCDG